MSNASSAVDIVEIKAESDIVAARQAGRGMAARLGFGSADQVRLATAISELTRNWPKCFGTSSATRSRPAAKAPTDPRQRRAREWRVAFLRP